MKDLKKLDTNGIRFNEDFILVDPPNISINMGSCSMRITQKMFKRYAEWYLEDQENSSDDYTVENFLKEIIEVCKKYKFSISHEDGHGAFIIENQDEENFRWFMDAQDGTKKY